jgi:hypothetical protein
MGRRKSKSSQEARVHVGVVQDRSGSMDGLEEATITGYNEYKAKVAADAKSETLLTLVQFDNEILDVAVDKPIGEVEDLNTKTYVPRGSTRLNDAIMHTVAHIKARKTKGDGAILVIMTDGHENTSQEFGGVDGTKRVKDALEKLADEGWDIIYLGAGPASWTGGQNLGIMAANTLNYANNAESHSTAYASVSSLTLRKTASPLRAASFTAEEKAQTEEGAADANPRTRPLSGRTYRSK